MDGGDSDEHAGGGYIRGSYQFAEPAYVFASFSQVSKTYHYVDAVSAKVTLSNPTLGIGYRMEMTERVDFVADVAYQRNNRKIRLAGYDAWLNIDGYDGTYKSHFNVGRANLGVRGKPSARTEAWIKAGYLDGSDLDSGEFVGTLGGQVNFTPTWGLVGELEFIDGNTQGLLGVRASF